MQKDINVKDSEDQILQQVVNMITVAVLAGPLHTYDISFTLISGKEKTSFIDWYMNNLNIFNDHFTNRLIDLVERAKSCSGILLIGFCPKKAPTEIDCKICNYESCDEYYLNVPNAICPLELMSYSSAISRGQYLANQLQVSNVLAQSIGLAAREKGIINAPIIFSLLLEIGNCVKTAKDNQMYVKSKSNN